MESFKDLNLSPEIMRAVAELGFEKPSPIQAQTLPILLGEPTDFLGLAATGTGKTAAFSIPFLEQIDPRARGVQVLVMCPTRELALQVSGQINLLGKYKGIQALPIYGGAGYGDQISGLRKGVSVVVGTPGRIIDHMQKGTLLLKSVTTIVLDEADEMISMGFQEDMETIISATDAASRKIWLFSATMSREVRKVADQYLKEPQQVQVNQTTMLSSTVEQIYYPTQESNKPEVLCKLIDAADDFFGIIFCQTKTLVTDLTQYLMDRGYKVDCLHGDKDQKAREKTMQAFRDRKVSILVCTDVACRGLDVKDVTHVINYSLPRELDNYVHRIGRTARSGKAGFAMSLVTPAHRALISRIEKLTKSRMKEGVLPTRKDIGIKKIGAALTRFQGQQNFAKASALLSDDWKKALEAMDKEEIAARFLVLTFPETFAEREQSTARMPNSAPPRESYGRRESRGGYVPREANSGYVPREKSSGYVPREKSTGYVPRETPAVGAVAAPRIEVGAPKIAAEPRREFRAEPRRFEARRFEARGPKKEGGYVPRAASVKKEFSFKPRADRKTDSHAETPLKKSRPSSAGFVPRK